MKKLYFIIGVIVGVVISTVVSAAVAANISTQPIFVDGTQVEMKAYLIEGNNYVRLRDIGKAVDFGVEWDNIAQAVRIWSESGYEEEVKPTPEPTEKPQPTETPEPTATPQPTATPEPTPTLGGEIVEGQTKADGSGRVSTVPLTEKFIDGKELCREDFSQKANPNVFTEVFTRGAYNAIKQSMIDREIILAGNNEDGFNPYYNYANFVDPGNDADGKTSKAISHVLSQLPGGQRLGAEPYVKNYWNFNGYAIVKALPENSVGKERRLATIDFIAEVNNAKTDKEKVVMMADFVADRAYYENPKPGQEKNIFTTPKEELPVPKICSGYTGAFKTLCEWANIPCISITGDNHAWSIVYADGQWLYVDVTNYDTARSMSWMLTEEYFAREELKDENPQMTEFIKELLIPGSTIK